MLKSSLFLTAIIFSVFCVGCGSSGPANAGTNTASNGNTAVKVDQANMPEGLNPQPVQPSANTTPGIPPVVANLPKGVTPTPGIPDAANLKKPMKPGATPTPGIPSPEEIRKALGQPPANVNSAPGGDQMMMKKNTNKLQKKP